ncbi:unnamed protein product [Urochloa decumbens]|uniref:Uncharacterized protein n=1 Tax=Urochloa decumbens TaxID=240449 RepID=A0ABC8WP10_9POAL
MASSPASSYDCSFKVLLIGDSAVGKSSFLVSFVSAAHTEEDIAPTIAGQERFRTITSSYYRGAHGIILVYDVTKRESFTNLADVWTKEIELHSTNKDCVKMLVGNKVDKDEDRVVTREEGLAFAQECGCLFLESSAKTRENVEKCFEELALKILEVPSLLEEGSSVVKRNTLKLKQENANKSGGCCQ